MSLAHHKRLGSDQQPHQLQLNPWFYLNLVLSAIALFFASIGLGLGLGSNLHTLMNSTASTVANNLLTAVEVTPAVEVEAADKKKLCGKTWPVFPEWHDINNPLNASYTTNSCKLPPFPSKESMTQCLKGRNVYLLGNSIARQYAYHVPLLLGSSSDVPDRESQKKHCAKEFGAGGCTIDAPFDVRVRNFWFLYLNGKPALEPVKATAVKKGGWEGDVCGSYGAKECLEKVVFKELGPRSSDILVLRIGIAYALYDPSEIQDISSWRKNELRSFIRVLNANFNGTVIWMTENKLGQNLGAIGSDWFHAYEDIKSQMLDMEMVPIILEDTNWTVYDGYHITEPLAYNRDFFHDNIHHPGLLTHLGWQFILGHICP